MPQLAYDAVLLEGEYVATILDNPGLQVGNVFLRVHNNETRYFMELGNSVSRVSKKLILLFRMRKISNMASAYTQTSRRPIFCFIV